MAFVFGDLAAAARDYFSGKSAPGAPDQQSEDLKTASQIVLAPIGLGVLLLAAGILGYSRLGDGMLSRILFGLGIGALLAVFIYSILSARQAIGELSTAQRQRLWGPTGTILGVLAVAGAIATLFWINPRHAFAEAAGCAGEPLLQGDQLLLHQGAGS